MAALTWEPKIPSFGTASSSSIGTRKTQITPEISSLYKPKSELIDGLFVPPNNPKQLNKLRRKQLKDTAGADWFDMPAPVVTPELKQDLQLLKLRNVIDPKRHYKKGDTKLKALPKYFQVGTVVESASDYYSARLTKKERKNRIAEELLADSSLAQYRKRKVREIEEHQHPGGNEKWKIKGKFTLKRAKEKRHLSEQRHESSGNNKNKRFKRL
ncbi:rRNA-processing protein fcf2-like [Chenopodium quinoa]|uniref:rRNA-processing protein fcf2-like n=1 Tax=Chenopodium quinoa TaxID=63459 RepID=UPI000B775E75|nr:rRNA-processing protein fcf2-like [Chenopodium quinoa]